MIFLIIFLKEGFMIYFFYFLSHIRAAAGVASVCRVQKLSHVRQEKAPVSSQRDALLYRAKPMSNVGCAFVGAHVKKSTSFLSWAPQTWA